MAFELSKNDNLITFSSPEAENTTVLVDRKGVSRLADVYGIEYVIPDESAAKAGLQASAYGRGWRITCTEDDGAWRNWAVRISPKAIVMPTREGELISEPSRLPTYTSYSLSYPGTASTKSAVVFTADEQGFVLGSAPSLDWARIILTRTDTDRFILRFLQKQCELFVFPFGPEEASATWEQAMDALREAFAPHMAHATGADDVLAKRRFFLQMGVRDFLGAAHIRHFMDLVPIAERYREVVGEGHFVHLFGTNREGFDRMLPEFTIDDLLGNHEGLARLVDTLHGMGLMTSHHFNPRIADLRWIDANRKYRDAVVCNARGNPWVEFYKGNVYYVMNPNHRKWRDHCLRTVADLQELGFDYIELDQIAYQRNLATADDGIGQGYQALIDATAAMGVKLWVEGVSDVYRLPPDAFFQILPRDRFELWETNENRRGYPYGTMFPFFYRKLLPGVPVSLQIVNAKCRADMIPERLSIAKRIDADVYDLELGFVDDTYKGHLETTLQALEESAKLWR